MDWHSIESLRPGKLAFLMFEHLQSGQWVGYVDEAGICDWPEKVQGLRPSAWQEVAVDLMRSKTVND